MAYKTSSTRNTWQKVATAYGGTPTSWEGANPNVTTLFPPETPLTAPAGIGSVNINAAGAAELTLLAGIGSYKARAIVSHRKKHGPFKTSKDLTAVKGIGEKTHARLKRQVRL